MVSKLVGLQVAPDIIVVVKYGSSNLYSTSFYCWNATFFTNVGLDYFGPIEVRRGRSMIKRYGVLFTCMSSRAIHLEVAYSLDTDSCIHALRRFICRSGPVKHIRSDNGTNLVGAQAELKALSCLNNRKIQGALLSDGIQWSYKLNSTLGQQTLDDEILQTILNNRHLCTVSSDPCDLEPLTHKSHSLA